MHLQHCLHCNLSRVTARQLKSSRVLACIARRTMLVSGNVLVDIMPASKVGKLNLFYNRFNYGFLRHILMCDRLFAEQIWLVSSVGKDVPTVWTTVTASETGRQTNLPSSPLPLSVVSLPSQWLCYFTNILRRAVLVQNYGTQVTTNSCTKVLSILQACRRKSTSCLSMP